MNNFTFLTEEQIFGSNQLDILKKYGTKASITDFSILLGGFVVDDEYSSEGTSLKDRTGWWWTKSPDGDNDARAIDDDGDGFWSDVGKRDGGVRPALPYSLISSISSNSVRGINGVKEVFYGEYPQTIVPETLSSCLESAYNIGNLKSTSKNYTTDSVGLDDYGTSFSARVFSEYEFNGGKFIRFVADTNSDGEILSDGRIIEAGKTYWVKVEPISWLIDEKENIALSKKIIVSGVQFKHERDYKGDFDKTDIKTFMDKYFSKEIVSSKSAKVSSTSNNTILNNIKLGLLKEEQVFGDNSLDIFKNYGTQAGATDLSIILGSLYNEDNYVSNDGHPGWYWLETYNSIGVCGVTYFGDSFWSDVRERTGGVRPVLPYSLISSISRSSVRGINGIKVVECGEYPQMVVANQKQLNEALAKNKLVKTGKSYTFDSRKYSEVNFGFNSVTYDEFMFEGKKYIAVKVNSYYDGNDIKLSTGVTCHDGDIVWIEVLPVEWLVDEKSGLAISKKTLVSGIRYDDKNNYKGDFSKTKMYEYLNKYMVKDLFGPAKVINQEVTNVDEKTLTRKQNPYNFNFDNVTEEDIIRGAVESNVSVFLHGRSSEGKSARVKQLDPDSEIIYMRNATPDSLNGKSVYNAATGEMIDVPPTWYTKIKEKCEKEPNKIHIIFFDELTNALPSIQGMAFNIVLDGEVNGKWKLPENARIVAAGNDLNDSLAANQMAEPLFNRFAHVYINTTVDSWLKWASTPKEKYERLDYEVDEVEAKIHPSIYAYVAYKSYCGYDVLRTPYNGEKPNADPRKWEMASKVLYKTRSPEMLRALIGEELTRDFTEFTKQQVITIEDVINHNYNDSDFEMNVSQKFATAVGLSSVDEEHFEIVREFMKQVGAEARAAFESMWVHGDEGRLEKLASIQMAEGGMNK